MGTPPAVVVYVISVQPYSPERIQHPIGKPPRLHTSPFCHRVCKSVFIFVTFATPKMWIKQLNSEDGNDSLTLEV